MSTPTPPLNDIDTPPPNRVIGPPAGPVTGEGFSVDPTALSGAARTIDAEATTLQEAVSRLQMRLTTLGPSWGDDVVGKRFAVSYEPAAKTVLGNVAALSVGLVHIAAALRAVAESYNEVDRIFQPTGTSASFGPPAIVGPVISTDGWSPVLTGSALPTSLDQPQPIAQPDAAITFDRFDLP